MAKGLRNEVSKEKQRCWQEKILTWKKSGLNKTKFCRQHDLNSRQFLYWSLKDKKRFVFPPTSIVPVKIKRAFIPLRVMPDASISLFIREDYRVEVSNDFDPITLKRVIQTLEGL